MVLRGRKMIDLSHIVLFVSLLVAAIPVSVSAQVCQCSGDAQISGIISAQEGVFNTSLAVQAGDLFCSGDANIAQDAIVGGTITTGSKRASVIAGPAQGLLPGTLVADTQIRGWAEVDSFGYLLRGVNVQSVSKPATGKYIFDLVHGVSGGERLYGMVQLRAAGPPLTFAYVNTTIGPTSRVTVLTYTGLNGTTGAGIPSDYHGGFVIFFFGG